jgi:hypothetical protein
MVLTDKKLSVLACVAVAMLAVTLVVHYSASLFDSASDFTPDSLLIQGLDPGIVSEISITKGDDAVTLKKTDKGYAVKERQGYLASVDKINSLFISLDIRCDARITANKEEHKELGVAADDKEATVVKLIGADGKVITGVVMGPRASRGAGMHIRLVDKDEVYATSKWVSVSSSVTDYVNTDLLKIAKDDVQEVTVTGKDSAYAATRGAGGAIKLGGVPKGKRAKDSDVESLFDALSSLTLDDMSGDASLAAEIDTTFTCRTKSHATYIVKLSKKDDKHYVRLSCGGPSQEILESLTFAAGDPDSKRAYNDSVLLARDNAPTFNKLHSNWVYEISSWTADRMRKSLKDLIEDIPAPKPDPPGGPLKVTASHILIGYKGSQRSEATRTKEEALKLAEDVATQAKAPEADFAALAVKHSDGPSGKRGGDLGEFDKNTMHPNFTEATWKLKVGDVSGVVETPFGFHVIKRTK